MKSRIQPSLVTAEHAYTRSDEPWQLDRNTEAQGRTATGKKYGWKLFHYLSGDGISSSGELFWRSARERRQNRFLVVAAALAFVWLCLLVF